MITTRPLKEPESEVICFSGIRSLGPLRNRTEAVRDLSQSADRSTIS
jgi:hypothetical protein